MYLNIQTNIPLQGHNYYRIAFQDNTGEINYTNTIYLNYIPAIEFNSQTKTLNLYSNEPATIKILNLFGQTVEIFESNNSDTQSFSLIDYPKGAYIVQLEQSGLINCIKVLL